MKGNDLDNAVVPRDVLVYEGLLGLLNTQKSVALATKWQKRGRWEKMVACFETNEMLARKIWDVTWRFSYEIDILTYLGDEFAAALTTRIKDQEGLPVRNVWFEDPYLLARRLVFTPNIRFVYDPDPNHQFVYGSKGRVMMPGDIHMLGA